MTPQIKQRIEQIRRGEVPEGYKKTKVGIVPNEWKETTVDKCVDEYVEKTTVENQYPVLTSARSGLMLQSEYYSNNQVTTNDNVGYNVLPRGYVTYRSRSDDGKFRFNENQIIDRGIISYFYPVFSFKSNVSHPFMLSLLNHTIYRQSYSFVEGTAQQVLSFKKLGSLKYCLPSLSEQQKIAEILSAQDKLIALKEKLIEEKKRRKKALMQQLLTGKKRLPGFSGEWDKFHLNQIAERITRKNKIGNDNVLTISAQYGLINQSEFFDKEIASEDKSNYFLLFRNDFAYNKSYSVGYPFGTIKQLTRYDMGIVSPLYICFQIVGNNASAEYLEHYFEAGLMNKEIQSFAQEGARNHGLLNISVEDFFNSQIILPPMKEQLAIAHILTSATKEIDLLQKDLEQEKQKKKALLQLLLTGIVRV